jgi:hypothetical protein
MEEEGERGTERLSRMVVGMGTRVWLEPLEHDSGLDAAWKSSEPGGAQACSLRGAIGATVQARRGSSGDASSTCRWAGAESG